MKILLTCLALLWPLAAAAQFLEAPKSVSDCERIKNDLAYNQCLASFGPKRGERGAGGATIGEDDDAPVTRPKRGGRSSLRTRGGRQAAAFDVMSGTRGRARSTPGATPRNARR
jgi:hypothetical protein